MPLLEINLPEVSRETKEKTASCMNHEFIEATGFEDERLIIKFRSYQPEDLAIGGKSEDLTGSKYVGIFLYLPRVRFDVKRSLVSGLNKGIQDSLGSDFKTEIYILEFPYDNLGIEGQLLTDVDEELASRPFYFVLPR